jgi:hypothetical protein
VALSDVTGNPRAALGVTADGPVMVLSDGGARPRATLAVAGPQSSLVLFGQDGAVTWRAP